MEINITEFLRSYRNKKIKYIPNLGNLGDGVISFGTLQIFKELNLDFEICFLGKGKTIVEYKNDLLIYGGGGGFVGLSGYEYVSGFLRKNCQNNEILVLPHTINGHEELINSFGDNVKLIARECVSYEHIKKNLKNSQNAFLSHDMAFNIKLSRTYKTNSNAIFNGFRCDSAEKTNIEIPSDNLDISDLKRFTNYSEADMNWCMDKMSSHLSKFKEINTNRLHVAIVGALLGKQVNFYPNSYYKNKEVYRYSMVERYPNVTWIEK